jgi:hypothetical protein
MILSEDSLTRLKEEPEKAKILTISERFYWSRHSGDGEVPLLFLTQWGGGGGERIDRIVNSKNVDMHQ